MTDLDPERTAIIPGLRPSDTPPLGTPFPEGRHRARRTATPRWAAFTVFGAPAAVVGVTVGLLIGWAPGDRPAPGAASPSHTAPSAVVAPPLPSPSRTDRVTPRRTSATPTRTPSPTATRTSPSPSTAPTSPRPSSSLTSSEPARPSPTPTRTTPTVTPTLTIIPEVTDEP